MADNVVLDPGSGGDTIAADDVGGAKHQYVKVEFGADGTATPVTAADPLPVTAIASALPTGAATAAKQDTGNTSLASIDGKITAVNTGAVVVASSALPAGAATAAKQDTGNTSLASIDGKITAVNTGAVVVASSALPTGASTAAKQPALGTAGTAATDVISVQGIASMTPLAVSASALPLPTGASTLAEQQTQTASLSVLDDWDETNRAAVNTIAGQVGVQGGSGTANALTQRVVLATDVPMPATPAQILQEVGTQIRFCVAGSFAPAINNTNWTIGTPTDVLLTLASVASAAARQSNKVDLGANRAAAYEVLGCVDYTGETPTQGSRIDYYWLPSTSTTAATGNVMGGAGADAACPTGSETGTPTLADIIAAAVRIGSLYLHDGACVQNGFVGVFRPSGRYGQLVVVNNGGDVFENDDVESHQVFNPIVDERQ